MEIPGLYTTHRTGGEPDSSEYQPHSHSSYEILMLLRGNCSILTDTREYALEPDDVALICKYENHSLVINDGDFEFLSVQFIPEFCEEVTLDPLLRELVGSAGTVHSCVFKPDDGIVPLFDTVLRRICDEKTDPEISMYFTYIRALLYELGRNATRKEGVSIKHEVRKNTRVELFNAISEYIGKNLSTISDLSFIEKEFHYSNSYVNRIFRSIVFVSVWQYITMKRLDLAKNLIASGSSAQGAAVRSGFNDYSVFYKAFVKFYQKSPSDVKRDNQKKVRSSNAPEEEKREKEEI